MRAANQEASGSFQLSSMRALISDCGLTYANPSAWSLCASTRASSPALNFVKGVCWVSTSLLKTHRCPACRRRSSLRFKRSAGNCATVSESDIERSSAIVIRIMHRNRLADETSPYLQQHAENPVDWYPWGEEALARAARENKPILLSIGYSACHWCHVMAHESFEDPRTAALMNELFVNIKVDREERPDLDKIYQVAQQLITQRSGGWPRTMFLTPKRQTPFFGGTYFPDRPRHGMPAFAEILKRVSEYYREHGAEIQRQSGQLERAFASMSPPAASDQAT